MALIKEKWGSLMPNLSTHLKLGVFTYPVFVLVYNLITVLLGKEFSPGVIDLSIGYVFFVFGSDLPDLDSNSAPLRAFTKALSLGFAIYIFYSFIYEKLSTVAAIPAILLMPISIFLSMLIGIGVVNLFLSLPLFSHRGFAHSITFAAIYGLMLYLFSYRMSKIPLFIGICGFCGVMVHMVADYYKKPLKIFKLK
ncbi:MAG TPA: metal-dependent hydrolase [Fervidobacterium sp.]|nr:metal-dependent hydrolase [Fervidobacterium sp.]HUM41326.1 metal-dependent hydrolase [Fervidobacterium sp.]